MTCATAAGRGTIKQLYGELVLVAYLPYDVPEAVQRFLEYYRPRLGILMETELWPNLLAQCSRHGVPVLLANARLSARSARGYRRWGALARPAVGALAAVCAQTAADAERIRELGARHVAVTGGSFAPLGGQNLIEALAAGAPVIVGPHMYNFTEATRLALDAGAAVRVRDARQAMQRAAALLADDGARSRMSEAGKALCAA